MNTIMQIRGQHGQWVFIAPISGLELTADVNNEFEVLRVTFVDRHKLPRIRKRLGIPISVSETKKQITDSDHFDAAEAKTFAILRYSGKPEEITSRCLQLVKDELAILSCSQLGFGTRRMNSHPRLRGDKGTGKVSHLFLNVNDPSRLYSNKLTGKFTSLVLDRRWVQFQRKVLFFKLLQILNKTIPVSRSWRDDLYRSTILIGQSQYSSDIAQSFLWNMIALELLLTEQGDRYTEILPKRMEAFLGWVGYWYTDNYEKRIKDIYNKRCQFVHDGKRESITIADLLFTDDLLLNLLINIVNHIKIFASKDNVIKFSDKVQAEHILGIKPKVRPKTLQFVHKTYTARDYEEI